MVQVFNAFYSKETNPEERRGGGGVYVPDKPVGELLRESIDLVPVSVHAARPANTDGEKSETNSHIKNDRIESEWVLVRLYCCCHL